VRASGVVHAANSPIRLSGSQANGELRARSVIAGCRTGGVS
jgi:hypothetical protein